MKHSPSTLRKVDEYDEEDDDGLDSRSEMTMNMSISHENNGATSTSSSSSDDRAIAAAENKAVFRSKIFVAIFLLVTTAAAGYLVFALQREQETEKFEQQFSSFAKEIMDMALINQEKLDEGTKSGATQVTAYAMSVNATWPFVTVPFWEQRGSVGAAVGNSRSFTYAVFVPPGMKEEWEAYSVANSGQTDQDRIANGLDVPKEPPISPFVFSDGPDGFVPEEGPGPYQILWQLYPYVPYVVNLNVFNPLSQFVIETKQPVLTDFMDLDEFTKDQGTRIDPTSVYIYPIFDNFGPNKTVVAVMIPIIGWNIFMENTLKEGEDGIICVIKNACANQTISYRIDGPNATYLGPEDYHDTRFDSLEKATNFSTFDKTNVQSGETCSYTMYVYPTQDLLEKYQTNEPAIYAVVVVAIFVFTSLVFVLYDVLVQRRQDKVMSSAVKTDAIVSSLFPKQFRDQLYGDSVGTQDGQKFRSTKQQLKNMFAGDSMGGGGGDLAFSKPVADLFPNATVVMADLAGFTAWSSIRDPSQVFTLLERVFTAFDAVAKRRNVYKVETVGDAYLAACGVPVARRDHAVVVARFAQECQALLPDIVQKLERFLGPGTGDLRMRFGIHTGPVTAGVMRGDKARFQLFGDTVNTVARIEASGMAGRVHISPQTAKALKEAGMSKMFYPRNDVVHLKGKGDMKTFWLKKKRSGSLADSSESSDEQICVSDTLHAPLPVQISRLVDWNFEVLKQLLKQVVASRSGSRKGKVSQYHGQRLGESKIVVNEVSEIIALPGFDNEASKNKLDPDSVDLGNEVEEQLHRFINKVAAGYNPNPFHNFQHASHVAMSVNKLLSRIVAPELDDHDQSERGGTDKQQKYASLLHDHTYGITSDPLTQFSIVLSALLHDMDHRGVPNGQLMKEEPTLAAQYEEKSVAEQHSVNLGWSLLMNGEYEALCSAIFTTNDELKRFRQIIVNNIMATDIFDKQLSALRKNRWEKAFNGTSEENVEARFHRKATIVIEHVLQASDVAHTMQHWHVYTTWNERLYEEMYLAYKSGRSEKDPTESWYGGEIWFFDNYIIPLAKKLAQCGVFGVSSDEYLSYALENRDEWEKKGKDMVAQMSQRVAKKYGYSSATGSGPPEGPIDDVDTTHGNETIVEV